MEILFDLQGHPTEYEMSSRRSCKPNRHALKWCRQGAWTLSAVAMQRKLHKPCSTVQMVGGKVM